jgi:hypothetical protein
VYDKENKEEKEQNSERIVKKKNFVQVNEARNEKKRSPSSEVKRMNEEGNIPREGGFASSVFVKQLPTIEPRYHDAAESEVVDEDDKGGT